MGESMLSSYKIDFFAGKYHQDPRDTMNCHPFQPYSGPISHFGATMLRRHMSWDAIVYINMHPLAYQALLPRPEFICWEVMQYNPANYAVYAQHPDKITWNALTLNPHLHNLVRTDWRAIDWRY
jgi:hypothetical protein